MSLLETIIEDTQDKPSLLRKVDTCTTQSMLSIVKLKVKAQFSNELLPQMIIILCDSKFLAISLPYILEVPILLKIMPA